MSTLKVTTVSSPDGNTDLVLKSGNSQSGQILVSANGAGVTLMANSTVNAITINTTSWTFSNNPVFSSNGLTIGTALYVANNGSVGIGTSSPSSDYKLDIHTSTGPYNTRFYNSNTSNTSYSAIVIGQGATGSAAGYIGTGGANTANPSFRNTFVVGTQSENDLVFNTYDTEKARILSNGAVTIGNDGAGAATYGGKLSVYSAAANQASIFIWSGGLGSGQIGIKNGSSNLKLYNTYSDGTLANGKGIDIDTNGNTGIGITPSHKLDVNGNALFRGTQDFNATDETATIYVGDTGNQIVAVYDRGLDFHVNSTRRMRIQGVTGNIGLAVDSPTARLQFDNGLTDHKINFYRATGDVYGMGVQSSQFMIYSGAGGSSGGGVTIGKHDATGFTENMRIRNDGVVTIPNQPAFYAYSANITTTTGAFVFLTTRVNIGNCYNTSNGRFTAPVAGTYVFFGHGLHRGNGGSGQVELTFYKNGSNVNTRGFSYSVASQSSGHLPIQITVTLTLAAGDYIQFGAYSIISPSDVYLPENLSHFAGHLIG